MSEVAVPVDVARQQAAEKFGAQGLIKLRRSELAALPHGGGDFLHINASPCTHLAGARYAAVAMSSSQAAGAKETLLDAESAVPLECVQTTEFASALDIPAEMLPDLIGAPATHEQLLDLMVSRYGVLRGWTAENAAAMPVVVSRLRRAPEAISADTRQKALRPRSSRAT